MIFFTAFKWDSFVFSWNWAHKHALSIISGRLALNYNKLLIILLYIFWSTFFPPSSISSLQFALIRTWDILLVSIPNFFTGSFAYFLWLRKITFLSCDLETQKEIHVSHHAHFKLLFHETLENSSYNLSYFDPNTTFSTYTWTIIKLSFSPFVKGVVSIFPLLNPYEIKKELSLLYHHPLGACFMSYNALWSLNTWFR